MPVQPLLESIPLKTFQYPVVLKAPDHYSWRHTDRLSKIVDSVTRDISGTISGAQELAQSRWWDERVCRELVRFRLISLQVEQMADVSPR